MISRHSQSVFFIFATTQNTSSYAHALPGRPHCRASRSHRRSPAVSKLTGVIYLSSPHHTRAREHIARRYFAGCRDSFCYPTSRKIPSTAFSPRALRATCRVVDVERPTRRHRPRGGRRLKRSIRPRCAFYEERRRAQERADDARCRPQNSRLRTIRFATARARPLI